MLAKLKPYLPWGGRAGYTMLWAFVVALTGALVAFVADLLAWRPLGIAGSLVAGASIGVGIIYVICGILINILRMSRTFKDNWNRPPQNQHEDWHR